MNKLFQNSGFSWNGLMILSILVVLLISCESEFIPEGTEQETEIVVEGYIEAGDEAIPPYILLTKSVSFFSEFNLEEIENLFVHDAAIEVFDGEKIWDFTEFCLDSIPPLFRPIILESLGLDTGLIELNICVYLESTFQLAGEIGKDYELTVGLENKTLRATTSIPPHVPLDKLWFRKPTDLGPDSLLELRATIKDFPAREDYYRYFTAVNQEAIRAPFQSVTDDAFFDGEEFEFVIPKGESLVDPPSLEEFGLFIRGDTVTIKWANMDSHHYEFWSTLEFNAVSQGPFSSYTQVVTNIDGGLGIWGGYSVSQYKIIAEE